MYQHLTILAVLLLHHAHCSLVIDSSSQSGVYVSDYCPKTANCAEGAHVMCMYYNPKHVMGPRCNRPKNVSITPELATKLLEISNAIRSKIALGKEKGKGGDYLPKGYGMFRLKWDSELATFAQVLANQCVLRHDMCRSTKKFSDPGQTAGLVRFTYPGWLPISKAGHFKEPGLTASKLAYAITQTLKSWYGQKDAVTAGMITSYPDWAQNPNSRQSGRLYLEMIYGPATHMGCGISAYTEYAYYDNNAALNYNSVQVICNYSARPRNGRPVYQTEPPTEAGYTIRCGCPSGMDEDADCLCFDSGRNVGTDTVPVGRESCSNREQNCKPSIVLLPIFTVEDAPPEKLIGLTGAATSPFVKKETEVEILDLFGPSDNNSVLHPMESIQQTNAYRSVLENSIQNVNSQIPSFIANYPAAVLNNEYTTTNLPISVPLYRIPPSIQQKEPQHGVINGALNDVHHDVIYPEYIQKIPQMQVSSLDFNQKSVILRPEFDKQNALPTYGHISQHQKGSVFSKVPTFELPKKVTDVLIPDVKPRKDFSRVKSLVQNYVNLKKNHNDALHPTSKTVYDLYNYHKDQNHAKSATETYLNSAEEKIINYNHFVNNRLESNSSQPNNDYLSHIDVSFRENSNDKLLHLLDKLEQEVKHLELDRSNKAILDAKLRKIYGSVVGKSEIIPKLNRKTELSDLDLTDLDEYASDHNNHIDLGNQNYGKKHGDFNELKELVNKNEMLRDDYKSEYKNEDHRNDDYLKRHNRRNDKFDEPDMRKDMLRYKHDDSNEMRQIKRNQKAIINQRNDKSNKGNKHLIDVEFDLGNKRRDYNDNFVRYSNKNTYNEDDELDRNHLKHNEEFNIDRKYQYSDNDNVITNSRMKFYNDEDEIRTRHLYDKEALRTRHIYSDAEEKKKIKDSMKINHHEDPLSLDRRRYYQSKLETIERKLHNTNSFKHHKDQSLNPQMRPVRPTKREEEPLRPGKNLDPLYMPDRARYLHGF